MWSVWKESFKKNEELFLFALAISLVALTVAALQTDRNWFVDGGFFAAYAIIALPVLLWDGKKKLDREFLFTFGVKPPKNGSERHLSLSLVHQILSDRAGVFQSFCSVETAIMYRRHKTSHEVNDELTALRAAQANVASSKAKFWRAHKLAKIYGFKVFLTVEECATGIGAPTIDRPPIRR